MSSFIKQYKLAGLGSNVQLGVQGGYIDQTNDIFTLNRYTGNLADLVVGTITFDNMSDGVITVEQFDNDGELTANSNVRVPTQQAVKNYIDNNAIQGNVRLEADTGGILDIDLETDVIGFVGGTNINTSGLASNITINLDSNVTVDNFSADTITFDTSITDSGSGVVILGFSNDETMSGNSPNLLPTQFAVRTFVENANVEFGNIIDSIVGNSTLTYEPDVGGQLKVVLGLDTFFIQGGDNITTSGVGNVLTTSLDQNITVTSVTADTLNANNLIISEVFTVNNDTVITGNLVVSGNVTSINTVDLFVDDPIIHLAANNSIADIVDFGFVGHYGVAGNVLHAGLVRDADDKTFKLITDLTQDLDSLGNVIVDFDSGVTASLVANLAFPEAALVDGNIAVNVLIDSAVGIANNINDTSIATTQAIADFVDTVGDGLLVRATVNADSVSSSFILGATPSVQGKTYYVDKIVLNVTSAFGGGNTSYALVNQGVTNLTAIDDNDIETVGTYYIATENTELVDNSNLTLEFFEIDGTTPSIPTTGSVTVNIHYNWV